VNTCIVPRGDEKPDHDLQVHSYPHVDIMPGERTPLLGVGFPGAGLLWRTGAVFLTAGMIAGAFGTHGLRAKFPPDKVHAWETATQYAIYNGLALLVLSMHPQFAAHRFAGPAITVGGLVFSGSIMALVLDRQKRFSFMGPITPLGGSLMMAGYASLLF